MALLSVSELTPIPIGALDDFDPLLIGHIETGHWGRWKRPKDATFETMHKVQKEKGEPMLAWTFHP
eukprot:193045-Rhodomonas_salina.1